MLNRRFRDAGFMPALAYLLLAIVFIAGSLFLFSKTGYAVYIYLLLALGFTAKLSETRRTEFLKLCFRDKIYKKTRIVENGIIVLPFVCFLLYKQLLIHALLKEGTFTRAVQQHEFASLEQEMKETLIGRKIDKLCLE